MTETVLVTGGAGYVGSHVCKMLAGLGMTPVAYDNLSHGHRRAVRWGPFEVGDLRDETRLEWVIAKHRPSAVMHFAGAISVGESMADPAGYYDNNVGGFLTLLRTMRRQGLDRIVLSSSAAVYGAPLTLPIAESHPTAPLSPYGTNKLVCEWMLADFARAYGLRAIALRYFNAAGADPEGELGEAHDPETHLVPLVLAAALGRRSHVAIFGDRYATRDGTCERDYIHVWDLAAAHVLALQRLPAIAAAVAYNLGNGRGYKVREVVDIARRVTGRRIETRIEPPRPGDPPVLVADHRRAERELGWRPAYRDLETQIGHAWAWMARGCAPSRAAAHDSPAAASPAGFQLLPETGQGRA